ncbi:MAG: hypothetical protein JWQ19_75 [Subtercola sp.]|nr:hypothetical protein [Subtercola sp.]
MENDEVPFGGASSSMPLTNVHRQLIRELVKEIATVADELTSNAIGRWPSADSLADVQLKASWNQANGQGESPVRGAHSSILFSNAAGADHARAFINTVNSKRYTFSLATLTRGGVEAFAKSYFLLSSQDAEELVSRHISIAIAEMTVSGKHNKFMTQTGEETDINEYLAGLRRVLLDLNLPLLDKSKVGLTPLATTLLDQGANTGMGRKFYSQLSGVAHGETAALGMFMVAQPGKVEFRMVPQLAVEYAGMLCASAVTVLDRMELVFGVTGEQSDRWNGVKSRADLALKRMQAMFP